MSGRANAETHPHSARPAPAVRQPHESDSDGGPSAAHQNPPESSPVQRSTVGADTGHPEAIGSRPSIGSDETLGAFDGDPLSKGKQWLQARVANLTHTLLSAGPPSSPKLAAQVTAGSYRYYAGFSTPFVSDVFDLLGVDERDTVLDPWNGSGTTTLLSGQRGIASIGIDINPVMIVVAKGRLISTSERDAALQAAKCRCAEAPARVVSSTVEPLNAWFHPRSAARVRVLINRLLALPDTAASLIDTDSLTISQAHTLTAAFLTVRSLLKPAMTSNPTWVRESLPTQELVRVTWRQLTASFLSFADALVPSTGPDLPRSRDGATPAANPAIATHPDLVVADLVDALQINALMEAAPMDRNKRGRATVVVGSPPYCTRIDYAAATRPELAVLGLSRSEQKTLRRKMLGTTTVEAKEPVRLTWSTTADELLANVTAHASQASGTYYRKWLAQYLDGYWDCLANLQKMTVPDAVVALVVQDSYYKTHHIDLAAITEEYAEALGWQRVGRFDYPVPRTMASINSRIRTYRTDFHSVEALLVFAIPSGGPAEANVSQNAVR